MLISEIDWKNVRDILRHDGKEYIWHKGGWEEIEWPTAEQPAPPDLGGDKALGEGKPASEPDDMVSAAEGIPR